MLQLAEKNSNTDSKTDCHLKENFIKHIVEIKTLESGYSRNIFFLISLLPLVLDIPTRE